MALLSSLVLCKGTRDTYLLKHLVDVCQNGAVQVTVLVSRKAIPEASLRHLKDGVLDSVELALDLRVVFGEI